MTLPFLGCATITALSATVSLGFAFAAIRSSVGEKRVVALYAGVRSLAWMVVALAAFRAPQPWLEATAVGMIIVQVCDALIGYAVKDPLKTWGPAATAVFNLAALAWLGLSGIA